MYKYRIYKCLVKFLLISVSLGISCVAVAQDNPKRSITKIAGDVYRFQNNFHHSLVVLTNESVVVVDPINSDAATWLKEELTKMTDKPVSHLIYSHSHLDHASGGSVYTDTATVIAHANAPEAIDGVTPDVRFDTNETLQIGDKTLELTWLGEGHGSDLIAVVVRPENVAFITDAAAPKRLPWRDMGGANLDGWINQIKTIESLDFQIFAPAHGKIGVKADATDARIYMEKLKNEVLAGMKAGKSSEDLVSEVMMEDYKDWQQYTDWRPLNVQGMVNYLQESGQVN